MRFLCICTPYSFTHIASLSTHDIPHTHAVYNSIKSVLYCWKNLSGKWNFQNFHILINSNFAAHIAVGSHILLSIQYQREIIRQFITNFNLQTAVHIIENPVQNWCQYIFIWSENFYIFKKKFYPIFNWFIK